MTTAPPPGPPAAVAPLAPLRLPPELRLTPEQFALVCAENPEAVLELDAGGHLIAMTPTGGHTSARNARLLMRLQLWADDPGQGPSRCSTAPVASASPMNRCAALMPPWCGWSAGRP